MAFPLTLPYPVAVAVAVVTPGADGIHLGGRALCIKQYGM
jgi:hypothetical protein